MVSGRPYVQPPDNRETMRRQFNHLRFLEVSQKHKIGELQAALRQQREDVLDAFKELLQLTEDTELSAERRLAMVNTSMRMAIEAGSST